MRDGNASEVLYMPCFSPTVVIPVCLSKLTGASWLFNKNGASCALKVH